MKADHNYITFEALPSGAGVYTTMTNRDELAKCALPSIINIDDGLTVREAKIELGLNDNENYDNQIHFPMLCAKRAYRYADAMIEESEK